MARRAARQDAETRRREILLAARQCFAKAGFHGTTIDSIASEAGLSKGAVYWHFPGKRELFLALIDQVLADVEAGVPPPRQGESARERLEQLCETVLSVDPGGPGMAELQAEFLAHAARDEELRERVLQASEPLTQLLIATIRAGVESGEFRDVNPEAAAYALIGSLDGLQTHQLVRPELDVNGIWRQTVELLIRGMEAK
jgi:AcrR family transcriptional regulator